MPAKSKSPFGQVDFKTVHFSDKEKSSAEKFIAERDMDWIDVLLDLADKDCKMSVKFDQQNVVYLISITVSSPSRKDAKVCYMFRHADLAKCIRIAHYYIAEVVDYGVKQDVDTNDYDW